MDVFETSKMAFELINDGNVGFDYKWRINDEAPFQLIPPCGRLEASQRIEVSFMLLRREMNGDQGGCSISS